VSADSRGCRSYRRDEAGTAAVEFAILGPVFLGLLFAMFAFGWGINGVMIVRFELERCARAYLVDPTLTQGQLSSMLANQVSALGIDNVAVSLTVDTVSGYKTAHAKASYDFDIPVPLVGTYPISYQTSVDIPVKS
jgi:Flp pilus assembly protein TadG